MGVDILGVTDMITENALVKKRELRSQYLRELVASLPTKPLLPLDEEMVENIERSGLMIVGGRGTGKTNVAKVIASQLINSQNGNIQVKITDSCQNWMHQFEPIYYQHINDDTLIPVTLNPVLGNTSGACDIYFGDDHFLYDIEYEDIDLIQEFIGTMVSVDYGIQRTYKKHGVMDRWIIWIIEEAQNVLGTYALNGKKGKKWLKMISESRNFNMNFIFIGQRLADISTKAVERCQGLLMGRMTGDNDLRKIKRICGKDTGVHEIVPTLEIGEFLLWDGEEATKVVDVPLYETTQKPIPWKGGMGL